MIRTWLRRRRVRRHSEATLTSIEQEFYTITGLTPYKKQRKRRKPREAYVRYLEYTAATLSQALGGIMGENSQMLADEDEGPTFGPGFGSFN